MQQFALVHEEVTPLAAEKNKVQFVEVLSIHAKLPPRCIDSGSPRWYWTRNGASKGLELAPKCSKRSDATKRFVENLGKVVYNAIALKFAESVKNAESVEDTESVENAETGQPNNMGSLLTTLLQPSICKIKADREQWQTMLQQLELKCKHFGKSGVTLTTLLC